MTYKIVLTTKAQQDIEELKRSGNKAALKKLDALLSELSAHLYLCNRPENNICVFHNIRIIEFAGPICVNDCTANINKQGCLIPISG